MGARSERIEQEFGYLKEKRSRKQLVETIKFMEKGVTTMKKMNVFIGYLVLIMLVATLAACASTRTHESTGEYVDDSVITTKVKALLAEDDLIKSFQIGVETYKGTVQLSGFVNSQRAVDKAGKIARSVRGVNSVKNNLIVK